ncbi:MAG TPA: hypothetical protein PLF81_21435 [Candidatus Anammoximicrobium sp.]|nr:hypothetical protein [Candidatus Anammoximicrobium sp.]
MSMVVFGAGAIGRGLLGELAALAGWPITFVETDRESARQLAAAGQYTVRLVGRGESVTRVTDYRVLTPADRREIVAALRGCPLAATAVGGANLTAVATLLGPALAERRERLPVLVCENWPHAESVLAEGLRQCGAADGAFACIPCSVERMVQRAGTGLDLIGESGESAWVPAAVPLPGLLVCTDLTPYYARKLYTNNAGHALLAYEGFLAGRETLCAALADPAIRARLEALLAEAREMLAREYALAERDLVEHVDCLLRFRFANAALADRVQRVARQPLRKLGPEERLIGLLRKLEKHHLPLQPICRTVAAALRYDAPGDEESQRLQTLIRREGAGGVLATICQLQPGEEGHRLCLAEWTALNNPKEKP